MHHIYSAPNCIRCKIVKNYIHSIGQTYDETEFVAQKEEFNTYYRANRAAIYRNPEGVEFPIYTDGTVIKQGSGEVIAYLLAGHGLEPCVTRSDLLHGWIAGLFPSACPDGLEDAFFTLVKTLKEGGLSVCLRVDGRKPELLQRLLAAGLVDKVEVNFPGPAAVYQALYGNAPSSADIAATVNLAKSAKEFLIALQLRPLPEGDAYRYLSPAEAAELAQEIAAATGEKQMPYWIKRCQGEELEAMGLAKKLEDLADADLFKYRTASRDSLFKTDIVK